MAERPNVGAMPTRPAADMNAPRIAIRSLDFFYGSNRALKSINLALPDRQVTGMIGPSGCGKSTLLRCLNRMYDLYPNQPARHRRGADGRRQHPLARPRSQPVA